jgi:RNA recognition motif-containing protein
VPVPGADRVCADGGGARVGSVVREIERINERELTRNVGAAASWHAQYKDSAYVYVGGLPYELNEGDVICIFSQYTPPSPGAPRRLSLPLWAGTRREC